MRNDPRLVREIKPGAIVQIVPEEDHGYGLQLGVVTKVESWGVHIDLASGGGNVGRSWNLIEPTGGSVVFGADGKRIAEQAPPETHHP